MATTNYTNGVTLTDAGWFNDVDMVTYDGLTTQILVGGGAGVAAVWTNVTGSGAPVMGTSPTITTSLVTGSTTFTALAGATTLLTIGGTGASAVLAIPGTLDWSGTTGALTVAGGAYIAKKLQVISDFAVNTNKFNVTASSGNTTIAGTLGVSGGCAAFDMTGNVPGSPSAAHGQIGAINTNGLQLLGNGSTSDVTIYNKNNVATIQIPTGTTTVAFTTGISVGGATAGAGGIAFPNTAVAVADANTLDDYEEGTWTPTLFGATTTTYILQTGKYCKIGRVVYYSCNIAINSVGNGSTSVIAGLPFTASTGSNYTAVCYFTTSATNITHLIAGVVGGSTTTQLYATTAAAAGVGISAIFQNGTQVQFSGHYEI